MTNKKINKLLNNYSLSNAIYKTLEENLSKDKVIFLSIYEIYHILQNHELRLKSRVFYKDLNQALNNIGFQKEICLKGRNTPLSMEKIKETLKNNQKNPYINFYLKDDNLKMRIFVHISNYRKAISGVKERFSLMKELFESNKKGSNNPDSSTAEDLFKFALFEYHFNKFSKLPQNKKKDFSYEDITGKKLFDENEKEITKELDFLLEKDNILYCVEVKNSIIDGSIDEYEIDQKLKITENLGIHFNMNSRFLFIIRYPNPTDSKKIWNKKGYTLIYNRLILHPITKNNLLKKLNKYFPKLLIHDYDNIDPLLIKNLVDNHQKFKNSLIF